jgi:N-acyl homoserine lactone hydrolase
MRERIAYRWGMDDLASRLRPAISVSLAIFAAILATGCAATSHPVTDATLGFPRSSRELEAWADVPGPVAVETVVGAEWEVPRSGLIDLDDPKAVAAGLTDDPEPVLVAFHAIRHPTRGLWIVDTGAERALRDAPDAAAVSGIVADVAGIEKMKILVDTRTWIEKQREPVQGVFLTHLHIDHISGLRDVPASARVLVGPGEAAERGLLEIFLQGVVDDAFEGKRPMEEWRFEHEPGGTFEGVIDVFGDRTVWALHVPGHTPGSTAFLARTPKGPVLMVGDACHTAWGWKNAVPPGTFSEDIPKSRESLANLQRFAERHPATEVKLGHQRLTPAPALGPAPAPAPDPAPADAPKSLARTAR